MICSDCRAISVGSLSHCSVLNRVCSSSNAEVEFGEVSFGQRVHRYFHVASLRGFLEQHEISIYSLFRRNNTLQCSLKHTIIQYRKEGFIH
jgi:hypothetical protein